MRSSWRGVGLKAGSCEASVSGVIGIGIASLIWPQAEYHLIEGLCNVFPSEVVPPHAVPFSLSPKELMERLAVVFGRRVRALRESRDWTQEQLAKASGLGAKHIGVIERGEKTSSFDAVEKLAKAFGVEFYELFVPHHRRTATIEREVAGLLEEDGRIDLSNVEEFLRGLRAALRKLDRKPMS